MPPPIEELIKQAVSFFQNGQIERAEIEFKKILELFPNHHLAVGTLGDFYLQIGQPDLALPLLRRLVSMRPFDAMAHFLLGVAYNKVARFWHGFQELTEADKLKQADPEIIRQMGWCLSMKGKIEKGRELLEKAISLSPNSPEAYADLGASYLFSAEYEKAKEWLEKSLRIDPEYYLALRLLENLRDNRAEFNKLSFPEKEKHKREIQGREYKKQSRVDLMMHHLSEMEASKEDLAEVTQEFKEMGLSGQITMFHDPNTPEGRAAIEYVKRHKEIKNVDTQKLNLRKIKQITEELLAKNTSIDKKKDLILTLAHQGIKEAFEALKKCAQNQPKELEVWFQMAIDECKSFLASNILDEPVIQIHKIGRKGNFFG